MNCFIRNVTYKPFLSDQFAHRILSMYFFFFYKQIEGKTFSGGKKKVNKFIHVC